MDYARGNTSHAVFVSRCVTGTFRPPIVMTDFKRIRTDLLALGLLAATLFATLSLVSYNPADLPSQMIYPARPMPTNLCGFWGAEVSHRLQTMFGIGSFFMLLAMVSIDIRLFSRSQTAGPTTRIVGWLLSLISLCVGLNLLAPGFGDGPMIGSGGYAGAWGGTILEQHFSTAGTWILISATFFSGMLIADEIWTFRIGGFVLKVPFRLFGGMIRSSRKGPQRASPQLQQEPVRIGDGPSGTRNTLKINDEATDDLCVAAGTPPARRPFKVNPPLSSKRSDREEIMSRLNTISLETGEVDLKLPDLDLLEEPEEFPYELLAKKAQVAAQILEKTFQEFGLNIHVAEIDTGPVITQFELELEAGLRLSKVTALADDLAIALRVPAVRIVGSIPGKNTVGVEVPNEKQVMVRLRELIETCPQEIEKKRIPIYVGKDVSGSPLVVDLTRMPHLLIAGRTGTGKSVCLNTLILSILMTRSPEQVKMLMIDPKMVELSPYKRIPHLMHPVITDMKKAEAVLAWAVEKMEERYDLLSRCGVRHLDGYNKLGKQKLLERLGIDPVSPDAEEISENMPYIVIIADEMADMMMTSGKDVEGHIIRLAQKSRAVGIHLVLATQKPTVDVITGLIKSNLPARISFQVASRTDSRVVLDEMGADRLLGNGDMLYLAPGTSHVTRAQGAFVSDDEINHVIDFFSDRESQYSTELAQLSTTASAGDGPEAMRKRDELYEQAVDIVIREGRGSVSLLQRTLGIGYGRGARLIDYMAEDGIVGEYNGSQAREVLYALEQWEDLKENAEEPELEEAVA